MSKELEYLNKKISDLEYSIAHPTEYTLNTLPVPIKVRIDDSAVYKKELETLKSIKARLEAIEKVGQCKSIVSLLEALDTLYYCCNDLKKLEQAYNFLKSYLALETANLNEALEYLDSLALEVKIGCKEITTIKQALIKAEKEHKALEIIKQKSRRNYNLALVDDSQNYKVYCEQFDYFINKWLKDAGAFEVREEDKFTEEEFNLLKEVLE